jgi:hypothetical protein
LLGLNGEDIDPLRSIRFDHENAFVVDIVVGFLQEEGM